MRGVSPIARKPRIGPMRSQFRPTSDKLLPKRIGVDTTAFNFRAIRSHNLPKLCEKENPHSGS